MSRQQLQFIVEQDRAGERLDVFLHTNLPQYSRSILQRLIEEEDIEVNGETKKPRYLVQVEDVITILLPDTEAQLIGEETSLNVIFEDDSLIVLNKPAGVVVHPNSFSEKGTLVHALIAKYPKIKEAVYDPEKEISRLRPGIVHRLDKETSGIMVVAKTKEVMEKLSIQFQEHSITKEYLVILAGNLREDRTVHTAIRRTAGRENLMGVSVDLEEGREAISHFHPDKNYFLTVYNQAVSLASCRIETGRTHQIRVHAKYIGMPVLGDSLYTNKPAGLLTKRLGAERQMLHAWKLAFTHPVSGKKLSFTAEPPADFQSVLAKIEERAQ